MMKNLNRLLDLGKRANRERLKIEDIEDNWHNKVLEEMKEYWDHV